MKKVSLADLIFRAIFVIFSILTVGITIYTYQLSANTFSEEVKRNVQQTSSLLTNFLNHRLAILQIRQDTDAGSLGQQNEEKIDIIQELRYYFFDIESKSPYNSPDLRFIEVNNELYWQDENNLFLGLDNQDLKNILKKNIYINTWYYIKIEQTNPSAHLLVRKTPIVASSSGEVRGYLYNAVVLNNNISFIYDLKKIVDKQEIFLTSKDNIIISSVKKDTKEYKEVKSLIAKDKEWVANKRLNKIEFDIKSLDGDLSILMRH